VKGERQRLKVDHSEIRLIKFQKFSFVFNRDVTRTQHINCIIVQILSAVHRYPIFRAAEDSLIVGVKICKQLIEEKWLVADNIAGDVKTFLLGGTNERHTLLDDIFEKCNLPPAYSRSFRLRLTQISSAMRGIPLSPSKALQGLRAFGRRDSTKRLRGDRSIRHQTFVSTGVFSKIYPCAIKA